MAQKYLVNVNFHSSIVLILKGGVLIFVDFFFSLNYVDFMQIAVFQTFLSAVRRDLSFQPRVTHAETLVD